MINAYEVGVGLVISGDTGRSIARIAEQFDRLQAILDRLQGMIPRLATRMGGLAEEASVAAKAWERAANAMERANRNGSDAGRQSQGSGYSSKHDIAMKALGYGILGREIFSTGADAFNAAATIDQMRATLLAQGVRTRQADALINTARTAARATPGVTIEQALRAGMDLRTVLGGTADDPASASPAMAALPAFVQNLGIFKKLGDQSGDESFASAKAAELLGDLIDEKTGGVSGARLQKTLDAAARVAVATNMRVSPTDYLAFVKQARASDLNLSDDYLFKVLPSLLIETGGSRAGTGEMAAWRQFAGGTMTKSKFADLKKLHLVDSSAVWSGGRVRDMAKHLKGYKEFDTNPANWVWNVLQPALAAARITDRVQQAQMVGTIMTNTGGGYFSALIAQKAAIQKDMRSQGAATTGAAAAATLNAGAEAKLGNFQTSLHNLLTDLGGPLVEPAGKAMDNLRAAMDGLGQTAHDHQKETRAGEGLLGGLGAYASAKAAILTTKLFGKSAAVDTLEILLDGFVELLAKRLLPLAAILDPSPANKGEADALKQFRADHRIAAPGSSAQHPAYTVILNAAELARAHETGLARGLSAAPAGPTGPTSQYRPRSPGM